MFVSVMSLIFGVAGLMCALVNDNWFKDIRKKYNIMTFFGLLRICNKTSDYDEEKKCAGRKSFSFNSNEIWNIGVKESSKLILTDAFDA